MQRGEAGYATPAAMVIGMAISVVAAATVARSVAELRLADQSFAKAQTEYELAAAHSAAALAIVTASQPPPYRWVVPVLGKSIEVVAEPELQKLNLKALTGLDETELTTFGVADAMALNLRLAGHSRRTAIAWISEDDVSPTWRACAASFISPYGGAEAITRLQYSDPDAGKAPAAWHSGQVWRLVAVDDDGWRDERLVRFTGDEAEPFAVIQRRVQKGKRGTAKCEALFG